MEPVDNVADPHFLSHDEFRSRAINWLKRVNWGGLTMFRELVHCARWCGSKSADHASGHPRLQPQRTVHQPDPETGGFTRHFECKNSQIGSEMGKTCSILYYLTRTISRLFLGQFGHSWARYVVAGYSTCDPDPTVYHGDALADGGCVWDTGRSSIKSRSRLESQIQRPCHSEAY
jgi:hypothetical protein